MKLQDYLKEHKGELIKLGSGSGFMFIGVIDDNTERELERIVWTRKPKIPYLLTREVLKTYPSLPEINEGTIVIVEGGETGKYWTKGEYDFFNNNHGADKWSYRYDGNDGSD